MTISRNLVENQIWDTLLFLYLDWRALFQVSFVSFDTDTADTLPRDTLDGSLGSNVLALVRRPTFSVTSTTLPVEEEHHLRHVLLVRVIRGAIS